jgi:hypothetical protein
MPKFTELVSGRLGITNSGFSPKMVILTIIATRQKESWEHKQLMCCVILTSSITSLGFSFFTCTMEVSTKSGLTASEGCRRSWGQEERRKTRKQRVESQLLSWPVTWVGKLGSQAGSAVSCPAQVTWVTGPPFHVEGGARARPP